jgi:precorrin-6Y C5,15-methyltransferase (decarboxylating)
MANIPAVAAAFARIKAPWQDVPVISLHGRDEEIRLWEALARNESVALYTDRQKNPAWIAAMLMENQMLDLNICVLERLGAKDERVDWYTPEQAAKNTFNEPNMVIIKRKRPVVATTKDRFLGMPEAWFAHEEGLITKAEVRAVALAKLRLKPDHTLWDLGAGSGSISIEAALFITTGKIIAVEKNAQRIKQIEENRRHFGIHNLSVREAFLPDGLEELPPPDRVFIGGGGRHLAEIIRRADQRLAEGGIMVINTVLLGNVDTALCTLETLEYQTEGVQVQVSRIRKMPYGQRLAAQNPVWVISGIKTRSP